MIMIDDGTGTEVENERPLPAGTGSRNDTAWESLRSKGRGLSAGPKGLGAGM